MYPYDFIPKSNFIDRNLIFIAIPFASRYLNIYDDLIIPSIDKVNEKRGGDEKLVPWKADDPKNTRSGWLAILEKLYTARIVLGVLTGNNPNVFYELGIAHSTQQIERQVLIAEKGYERKFDLKDLIYREYDPGDLNASVDDLVEAIEDTLKLYDYNNDQLISKAHGKLSLPEVRVCLDFGDRSHFALLEEASEVHKRGFEYLTHAGLLRTSTKPKKNNLGSLDVSYYWTDLGNAVLNQLDRIDEKQMLERFRNYL
ncbi:MAG: hypothetical protein JRI72_15730 [Deltaproteobacteria bacterium]|nr:hypothetical protein [Deltaproteobacteria bacterium]